MTPSCSSVVIRFRRWEAARKAVSFMRLAKLQDLVARQHQLPHQIHHLVQQSNIHPDGAVRGSRCGAQDCWMRSASTTSAGRAAPCSTRISPMRRGSPSFCCSAATQDLRLRDAGASASECRQSKTVTRPLRKCASGTGATSLFAGASGPCCKRVSVAIRLRIVALSFPPAHVDTAEHLADRIHHAQQRRSELRVERKLSVAQPSQQALSNVRNLFQFGETQKAAGAFDGVNGTEHPPQRPDRGGFSRGRPSPGPAGRGSRNSRPENP